MLESVVLCGIVQHNVAFAGLFVCLSLCHSIDPHPGLTTRFSLPRTPRPVTLEHGLVPGGVAEFVLAW